MVHEHLYKGRNNARTGRELARLLHCDVRTVTAAVARERAAGWAICSETRGKHAGYFLAANEDERRRCCNSLLSRGREIFASRSALMKCDIDNEPED